MNPFSVIKAVNDRRRRVKIRRLKYTCKTRNYITLAGGDSEKNICVVERETVITGGLKCFRDTHEAKTRDGAAEISLTFTSSQTRDHSSSNEDIALAGSEGNKSERIWVSEIYKCPSYGSVSVIGMRQEMEDTVGVGLGLMSGSHRKYDFFGVYDGHGGARVAEACKNRLHKVVEEEMIKEEKATTEWDRVMDESFRKMDEEVVEDKMIGSTAVVAVVGEEELVVANCGDSRAVLSKGGVAVPLSVDHKPDRPDELERVEAAGGRVINWNGHRVLGVLATSRSIGDQFLKPFVTSKPDVTVNKRSEDDEFLILASDGLWDVMTNEAACQIARRCLSGRIKRKSQDIVSESGRAAEAAAVLAEVAMGRGSRDNISVIVVALKRPSSLTR